jgi:hypothetical protein
MEQDITSYVELKDLVDVVRLVAFMEFKKQEKFNWKLFVYQHFLEAYSLGKYEDLFVIWKGGLEQMQGRNLISVVKELIG